MALSPLLQQKLIRARDLEGNLRSPRTGGVAPGGVVTGETAVEEGHFGEGFPGKGVDPAVGRPSGESSPGEDAGPATGAIDTQGTTAPGRVSAPDDLETFLDYAAGTIVQVHGSAALTLLVRALVSIQRMRGRPPVYLAARGSVPFPPDLAAMGADLAALPILFPRDEFETASMIDTVLRSRVISALVADIPEDYRFDLSRLSRFMHILRNTGAALFFLQPRDTGLLSSSVGLKFRADIDGRGGMGIRLRVERSRVPLPDMWVPLHAGVC